jgi:hypothetical protein
MQTFDHGLKWEIFVSELASEFAFYLRLYFLLFLSPPPPPPPVLLHIRGELTDRYTILLFKLHLLINVLGML